MNSDLTVSELFQAYFDCRRTKRNTWNALAFEERLERNVMDLYYELISGEYTPGRSIMFVVTRPKPREVWAADFRDRIVHHALYNRWSDHFYRRFIYDSYACIPEKGTLKAANRVQHMMRSALSESEDVWYLKADVSNFFVSIDKRVLDRLLVRHITDPWWVELTRKILHKNPLDNVHIKSTKSLLAKVPPHKSLLNALPGFGLPIGNLSSQFFANVYLNELDQYAKHHLKLKRLARYVDDVVVIGHSGSDLHKAYHAMDDYLQSQLSVRFHANKKEINRVQHGVNFVGYIIKPYCKYIRRSTVNNLYKKADRLTTFPTLRPVVNSYLGMMRQASCWTERRQFSNYLIGRGYRLDRKLTKIISGQAKCISA